MHEVRKLREVKSLARGLDILELLTTSENGLANKEIAEKLGINKSVISRFVNTLVLYEYAEKRSDTGRFTAGPRIVQLSHKMLKRMQLRDQAKPFLRKLVELTGECAHLAISSKTGALCIDQVETDFAYQVTTEVGTILHFHCTALGKVIAAYDQHIPELIELPRLTPRTITDRDIFDMHLSQIRKQGYAIDDEENILDVRCVAAPVFGLGGNFLGAIGISGPATHITLERIQEIASIIVDVARDLSGRMGFGGL
jgi:DNA-binding IclR family transcriptional regulator